MAQYRLAAPALPPLDGAALARELWAAPGSALDALHVAGQVNVTSESAGSVLVEIKTLAKAGLRVVCTQRRGAAAGAALLPKAGAGSCISAAQRQVIPSLLEPPGHHRALRAGAEAQPVFAGGSQELSFGFSLSCSTQQMLVPEIPWGTALPGTGKVRLCTAARTRRFVSWQSKLTQRQTPWKPVEIIYLVQGRSHRLRGLL